MALILALSRRLPEARDNQAKRAWRGMIGDLESVFLQRRDGMGQAARRWHHRRCI
jgi:hypothetical protein